MAGSAAIYAGYIVVGLVFLFPLLWVASLSLRPMAELFAFPPRLVPQHPTFAAYHDVLSGSPLARYLLNSVKLVSATVLVRARDRRPEGLCPVAPALPPARAEIAGHAWHARGATDLAPGHRTAAVSLVFRARPDQLACRGRPGLYRAQRAVRHLDADGFLDTVPVALDEAARIDGCTRLQSLLRVLLPVMLPGLASTAILLAISTWAQFIVPFVLLTRDNLYPVSVGILDYQSSSESVSTHLLAAAAILWHCRR